MARPGSDTSDYLAIQMLVARFDDAVNQRSLAEFSELWATDGRWEIEEPLPMKVSGAWTIAEHWGQKMAGTKWLFRGSFAGVVELDGDTATGRWPCVETGQFMDGTDYDNRALYLDSYIKQGDRWLFQSRLYRYMWLSRDKLPGTGLHMRA
jgi:ketosteroid isomerase-like protein